VGTTAQLQVCYCGVHNGSRVHLAVLSLHCVHLAVLSLHCVHCVHKCCVVSAHLERDPHYTPAVSTAPCTCVDTLHTHALECHFLMLGLVLSSQLDVSLGFAIKVLQFRVCSWGCVIAVAA
jgi:hypothetical protein